MAWSARSRALRRRWTDFVRPEVSRAPARADGLPRAAPEDEAREYLRAAADALARRGEPPAGVFGQLRLLVNELEQGGSRDPALPAVPSSRIAEVAYLPLPARVARRGLRLLDRAVARVRAA